MSMAYGYPCFAIPRLRLIYSHLSQYCYCSCSSSFTQREECRQFGNWIGGFFSLSCSSLFHLRCWQGGFRADMACVLYPKDRCCHRPGADKHGALGGRAHRARISLDDYSYILRLHTYSQPHLGSAAIQIGHMLVHLLMHSSLLSLLGWFAMTLFSGIQGLDVNARATLLCVLSLWTSWFCHTVFHLALG